MCESVQQKLGHTNLLQYHFDQHCTCFNFSTLQSLSNFVMSLPGIRIYEIECYLCLHSQCIRINKQLGIGKLTKNSTVSDLCRLTPTSQSEPQEPGTSKLDWRYFEHYKVDRNELQVRKSLHKGTVTKMIYFFLSNCSIFQLFLFLCLYANFWEPGVHSYKLYCVQSTSSPILKSLVPVD